MVSSSWQGAQFSVTPVACSSPALQGSSSMWRPASARRIVARLRQLGLTPDVMVGGDGGLPGLDIVFERPGQRPLGLQVSLGEL